MPFAVGILLFAAVSRSFAVEPDSEWSEVLEEARGQTVYFNAWGGSDRINGYLGWVGEQVKAAHGVTLEHVKVADIAEVVGQLEAAKLVGRDENGNVDLMWINGENFAALKRAGLLWGSFANNLPNARLLKDSASVKYDFSVPVEGLESPWGGAQLVFIHDTDTVAEPPRSAQALLEFVNGDGRFAYPAPPAFHGTTFVKQLLIELLAGSETESALSVPVEEADFDVVTAPLWAYLDQLHPRLRGAGKSWPTSGEMTRQLLDDGELDIAISFNPNEASAAVKGGQLPESVRTYVFDNGTIGNTHFVSIPWNASASAGAMVVADFLISPEAQARKADPEYWGEPTVLDLQRLDDEQRALFDTVDPGVWALPIGTGKVLPEPHASWAQALEAAWLERYGQ
ncbi:ABC transporter substrate-binding protein [Granulosicoccus sp. 3-233]|uniref:ABC transporter substrate-binding protein n=1 Tax=Granulosicoccus sp. 3-233 TaxID=3417969 RepID=UPI003D33C727